MRFEHVCIESIAVALPEESWTSAAIEERLISDDANPIFREAFEWRYEPQPVS